MVHFKTFVARVSILGAMSKKIEFLSKVSYRFSTVIVDCKPPFSLLKVFDNNEFDIADNTPKRKSLVLSDPFFEPYNRDEIAYGEEPSAGLRTYLEQVGGGGRGLDLGAGAGRDTIALAKAGYSVLAVDLSSRGLQRIAQRAIAAGVESRVKTTTVDVRDLDFPPNHYDAIVATTVLDHIPAADAETVWQRIADSLTDTGVLYVQVHTVEDPGSPHPPGCHSNAPISETADAVINYFAPNQLATWAIKEESRLRILRYEERLEWDYTHGPEHLHGKAVLLATRLGHSPNWWGHPIAFPKNEPSSSDETVD